MSPTKRPFQPTFFASVANRSMKRMSCGLPQLRLRDGRMTCQVGPVIDSDTAPARQPSKSPPIERGAPRNGVDLRANSSLAGLDGASGFFSGGSGLGLSEPGSIGSIKCFSCATAELAAATKRTARRQTTARIQQLMPRPEAPLAPVRNPLRYWRSGGHPILEKAVLWPASPLCSHCNPTATINYKPRERGLNH